MRKNASFFRSVKLNLLAFILLALNPLQSSDLTSDKDFKKFLSHVKKVYLEPNGKDVNFLKPREVPIFLGYALGKQAPYVQGKVERKALFDKLHDLVMKALDNYASYIYQSRLEESSSPGPSTEVLRKEFRELAVAAMGGYVDDQIERAIKVPRVIPSIFEGEVFNLRKFRISEIAGEYKMSPVNFQGNTYTVTLLTESGHVGNKMKGVAKGWTFTTTKIFFKDFRNRVMFEFSWYGNGVFRGYSVFQNSPNKDRIYELRRTDGFKFDTSEDESGSVDDIFTPQAIPEAMLKESVVRSDFEELRKAVKRFDSAFVGSRMTGKAKETFTEKLTAVFSGSDADLTAKAKLLKKIIPLMDVSIDSVKIDRENLTATVTASIGPSMFLQAGNNIVNMRLEGGQWRVADFRINPRLKEIAELLDR